MPGLAAIIPARWGSTRFPGKPLHPIAGRPLIQHVWERCMRVREFDEVVVATDDMRIAEAAFDFGAAVALTSPLHPSGTDRVAEVARRLRKITHIINVQGDEPLVAPALLRKLSRTLLSAKIPMITAATPIPEGDAAADDPNVVKVALNREGDALYFSRSRIPFCRGDGKGVSLLRHQGIYGYTRAFLLQFIRWKPTPLERCEQLEQLRALENGARIRVVVTSHRATGVDTPADVARVEAELSHS
jgi:3-deoxy-manno-octulosonate cytidylyltransferase (CMP-KDO synthetase)